MYGIRKVQQCTALYCLEWQFFGTITLRQSILKSTKWSWHKINKLKYQKMAVIIQELRSNIDCILVLDDMKIELKDLVITVSESTVHY